MAEQQNNRTQPRNIFEAINMNIVDMSQDLVALHQKVDAIYNVLFPAQINSIAEPDAPGADAEKNNK